MSPPAPTSSSRKAARACKNCRRLKRKCTRELPFCSLCVRLDKACDYQCFPGSITDGSAVTSAIGNLEQLKQLLEASRDHVEAIRGGQGPDYMDTEYDKAAGDSISANIPQPPAEFFLDPDFHQPLPLDALSSAPLSLTEQVSAALSIPMNGIYLAHLDTVHTWLPIISPKRLLHEIDHLTPETQAPRDLLLLCMALNANTEETSYNHPRENERYGLARSACAEAEMGGFLSLRLVQSLVLLAVYEFGHGIHPTAYLTVGRAARLASLMNLDHRETPQKLFLDPDTWTGREEQRRTWWAIFVLDRLINCETEGLPLAAPEPCSHTLLPISDVQWAHGGMGPSEPLLTTSFSSARNLGPFARLCQAAHILGKVIEHRDKKKQATEDVTELLSQAMQLHCTLTALEASLDIASNPVCSILPNERLDAAANPEMSALGVCSSARYMLYALYACNEPDGTVSRERIAQETEMQRISIEGIKAVTTQAAPQISRGLQRICASPAGGENGARPSPLVFPALYHAATECAWFIKEDDEQSMYQALRDIVHGMQTLGSFWAVGGEYQKLLDRGDVCKHLENRGDVSPSQLSSVSVD